MTRYARATCAVLVLNSLCLTVSHASAPLRDSATIHARAPHPVLKLALKHYPLPGAQPVLLIHGLAQNDRCWDNPVSSFAQFLHGQGFDVWVGNLRGAGTVGFQSEKPQGPQHWSIDDYAIEDVPALVDRVREVTGQAPFLVGHSLAAWALEGYFAGVNYDAQKTVVARQELSHDRLRKIKGVATIAGVYKLRWVHSLKNTRENPVRSETDYYRSNYELELLTRVKPLYPWIYSLDALPLGWISSLLFLRLDQIPVAGKLLTRIYPELQHAVISTPILNMFYYAPNSDPEMVRAHARDGLEDISPRLIEQFANAIRTGRTESYYHATDPSNDDVTSASNRYDYSQIRRAAREVPMLFIGGTRDRLASADQIFEDGYLATNASNKTFLPVEAGHLDILTGKNARELVMRPLAEWMKRNP